MDSRLAALLLAATASAFPAPEKPAGTAWPAPGPVRVDGDLSEWRALLEDPARRITLSRPEQLHPAYRTQWRGPQDLSARIVVAYDAASLYVVAEVTDDQVVRAPGSPWHIGDAIEVFLDTDLGAAGPENTYGEDEWQIFLVPLQTERRWAPFKNGRELFPGEARFQGVQVASSTHASGYSLEARLPYTNFKRLSVAAGARIGFDVALDDLDDPAGFSPKTYLSWSGGEELYLRPSRFGVLVFAGPGPPPATPAPGGPGDWSLLLPASLALGLCLLISWLLHQGLKFLARRTVRFRALFCASLVGALAALFAGVAASEALSSYGSRRRFRGEREAVTGILTEARAVGLAPPRTAGEPPLLRLLRGETVETRRSHEFHFVERSGYPLRHTEELATPCIVGLPMELQAPGPHSFHFAEGERGDRLHLVLSLEVNRGLGKTGPEEGSVLGEATLHYRGGTKVAFPLRYGVDLDDRNVAAGEPRHLGAQADRPTVRFAFRLGGPDPLRHADEMIVPIAGPPLRHLELAPAGPHIRLTLHALTLQQPDGDFRAVPLRRRWAGLAPAELWPDAQTQVATGESEVKIPLQGDRRADRLWVFYTVDEGFPLESAAPRGTAAAALRVGFASGPPLTVPLVSGVHLDDRRFGFSRGHPRFFESHLAFSRAEGSFRAHADVLEVALGRGEPVREITLARTLPRTSERIRLLGLTLGQVTAPVTPGPESPHLEPAGPGAVRLRPQAREALGAIQFALLRPGDEDQPEGALEEVAAERGQLSTILPFPEGGEDRLLLLRRSAGRSAAAADVRDTLALLLLALLLPASLTLLTDLLGRGRRLRVKMTAGFLSVSVAPLLFLFLFLNSTLRTQSEGELRRRAEEVLARARENLEAGKGKVRLAARETLSDPTLQGLLAGAASGAEVLAALERLPARLSPDLPGATLVLREHGDTAAGPPPREATLFSDPGFRATHGHLIPGVDRTDLYVEGGAAALVGVDVRKAAGANRWQELLVAVPLEERFLRELVRGQGDAEAFIFLPGGFLYASSTPAEEARAPTEVTRLRRLLAAPPEPGRPVRGLLRAGGVDLAAAFGHLADSGGRTVAVLAGGVPVRPTLLFGERVRRLFLVLGSILIVLVVLFGSLMTDRITGPIERLEAATRAVARGDLDLRVHAVGPDEVGALTAAFNEMAADLKSRLREHSLLNRALRAFSAQVEPEGVARAAADLFREVASPDDLVFLLYDRDSEMLRIVAGERRGRAIPPYETPLEAGPLREVLHRGEPAVLRGLGARPLPLSERRVLGRRRDLVALPVTERGETAGLVCLMYDALKADVPAAELAFLGTLANQFAAAADRARLYRLAIVDPESGLYVQPYFEARLEEELSRADRSRRPVALLRVDLAEAEAFAARNDPRARAALLRAAATSLREGVPRMFPAARAGSWSFAVMAPEVGRARAREIAEGVREAFARSPLAAGGGRHLSLTPAVGIALFPDDARSAADLLAAAERALGRARAAGGKRVASLEEEDRRAREATERSGWVFRSEKMLRLLETVERIAAHDATVLIQGETGVGKDVFAEMIHRWSPRRAKPLVKVNCSALPDTLLESELFGHEKGAFTGALKARAGRFEVADGGTIFLDEIGELTSATQTKLLRVLHDKRIERLGGNRSIPVDVRIIAATNRDLKKAIQQGVFREDLYFRLHVISITIPPLRERREEIPLLAEYFLRRFNLETSRGLKDIAPDAMDLLYRHDWPGNIRELRNTLERAFVVSDPGASIEPRHIFLDSRPAAAPSAPPPPPAAEPLPTEVQLANARQAKLIDFLRRRTTVTNREYFELAGVSHRTGLRDIQDLIRKGVIERIGTRRGASYRLRPLPPQGRPQQPRQPDAPRPD